MNFNFKAYESLSIILEKVLSFVSDISGGVISMS
jgi:hypothetical protein